MVNSFGIDRDTLPSVNALIPVVYYLYQLGGAGLRGGTFFEVDNADRIRRWLTLALLSSSFGAASDTTLAEVRRVLQEHRAQRDFPIDAMNAATARSSRGAAFGELAIESFLGITYGQREAFLALSLLYDERGWGTLQFHQDHIFPRSQFTPARLAESGLSAPQQLQYRTLVNRIGNLQLLLPHENLTKLNQPFEQWLVTQHPDARQRHLLPADTELYAFDRFADFVAAREDLIRQRLRGLFAGSDGMTGASDERSAS